MAIQVHRFCGLSLNERHSGIIPHGLLDTGGGVWQTAQVLPETPVTMMKPLQWVTDGNAASTSMN